MNQFQVLNTITERFKALTNGDFADNLVSAMKTSPADIQAQTRGLDGRYGWLSPQQEQLDDGSVWVVPFSPEMIADQLNGFSDEVAAIYLSSISFFAYAHITYMIDGVTDFDERNRLAERDAVNMPNGTDYLRVISAVQIQILDRLGAA